MSTTSQITNPYISVDSLPLNDHRYAGVVIVTRARAEAITCLTMKYLNAQKEKSKPSIFHIYLLLFHLVNTVAYESLVLSSGPIFSMSQTAHQTQETSWLRLDAHGGQSKRFARPVYFPLRLFD